MSVQLMALVAVVAVVIAAAAAERARAWRARRSVAMGPAVSTGDPYILYFTGKGCTVCRTHQEPALSRLPEVRVERVDAIENAELARRFRVYTLPTTIVMSAAGSPLDVNYGYAPATKLRTQLARARGDADGGAERVG